MFAGRQVGISRFSLVADKIPVFVEAFQFVFVLVLCRYAITQTDIFDTEYIIFIGEFDFFDAGCRLGQEALISYLDVFVEYLQVGNNYRWYISVEGDSSGYRVRRNRWSFPGTEVRKRPVKRH